MPHPCGECSPFKQSDMAVDFLFQRPERVPSPWLARCWGLAASGLTTALALPLNQWLDPVNTVMLFLLTVALVASRLGRGPAVIAAVSSVAAFDFFFIPPRWSFQVHDIQYLLSLAVMLSVALIISHLAESWRQQIEQAHVRHRETLALYELARQLGTCLTPGQVDDAARAFVHQHLHAELRVLMADADALSPLTPTTPPLDGAALMAAHTVYRDAPEHPSQHLSFDDDHHQMMRLQGATRCRGVMVISTVNVPPGQPRAELSALSQALATLVAAALERLHFVEVAQQTQVDITTERLRGSILSALSHDIRTPLTALYGTADALTVMQPPLPLAAQEMAQAVRDQAGHLHDMVIKLLDMARLHAGHVPMHLEWQPLEEVIGASIQSLGAALSHHPVKVSIPEDFPLVCIDAVLFERVLANLLENAAKYSPDAQPIELQARVDGSQWQLCVSDRGMGFPPDKLTRVFELFERGVVESSLPGVGLGLAICKAIVEAHGGRIEASNHAEGGAQVCLSLALGTPPTLEPEVEA